MQVSSRKTRRLLDKSKTFHVACGVAICIFSGKKRYCSLTCLCVSVRSVAKWIQTGSALLEYKLWHPFSCSCMFFLSGCVCESLCSWLTALCLLGLYTQTTSSYLSMFCFILVYFFVYCQLALDSIQSMPLALKLLVTNIKSSPTVIMWDENVVPIQDSSSG